MGFSLTPGKAKSGALDYEKKEEYYIYKAATYKLSDELYDCDPEGFYQFLKILKLRADAFGWIDAKGICMIPIKKGSKDIKNLLEDYGLLSLDRVREHAATFYEKDSRSGQDDRMLFECLFASLTTEGTTKLNVHEKQYTIKSGSSPVVSNLSGICLLKILIRESHLDSNATTGMIRNKLSNLDTVLMQNGNDVLKFNRQVQMLLDALNA